MENRTSVARAAVASGKTYHQILRLITTHRVRGNRDDRGWWVDADDLARYVAEERADAPQAA